MGIFDRFTRPAAPTVTDPVVDAAESPVDEGKDIEKSAPTETVESTPVRHHVSPEVEKRVVRKLDMHAMPLIAVLCTKYLYAKLGNFDD